MNAPLQPRGVTRRNVTEITNAQSVGVFVIADDPNTTTPPNSTADNEADLNDASLDSEENDDDGSGDESDDSKAGQYAEANKPWPSHVIYDERIPQLFENLRQVAGQVVETFTTHKAAVKHVEEHIARARELIDLPKTTKLRIAVLGNAGTGKSSLLNAVTDCPDLAKSLSGGESCSCVPTEYSGPSPSQEVSCVAIVEYIPIGEFEVQLKEIFRDYCLFTFEKDRSWDEDRQTYSLSAKSAIKTLCTLFCDLPDLKNLRVAKISLAKSYNEDGTQTLLQSLLARCKEKLQSKTTGDRGCADVCEADTLQELRAKIDPLTASSSTSGVPGLWPLVERNSMFVKGSRVLDRVTLVDLPGSGQHHTEYIKTCDNIWAVADVARVADDRTVYQLLSRYGIPFEGRVLTIPTHTDDVIVGHELTMTNYLENEGCVLDTAHQIHDQYLAKKLECRKLNRSIQQKKTSKRKFTHTQRDALQRQEVELSKKRAEAATYEQQRVAHSVEARNKLNTTKLMDVRSDLLPKGQDLVVHCVSNYHYLACKGAKFKGAKLTADETGILNLRAHVLGLCAPDLLRTFEANVNQNLPSMLHDILSWLEKTTVEGAPRLLELVKRPQHGSKKRIEDRLVAFTRKTQKLISVALQDELESATESAAKEMSKIAEKHHSTNELFTTTFTGIAEQQWPLLVNAQQHICETLERGLCKNMTEVKDGVKAWPMNAVTKHKLLRAIDLQTLAVAKLFVDNRIAYKKTLRNILIDITQDSHEGFFAQITSPVYDACNADCGAGVTKRSLDRLETHLKQQGDSSPFARMEAAIAKRLESDDAANVRKLGKDIALCLKKVYKAIDDLVATKRADAPAETAMRDAVVHVWSKWDDKVKEVQAEY
ncbi:hypothetical protein B0A48_14707 [Cryoendolithus antarcticus]|uniref:Uncharacterized protein n=1 Tax=Cryoendolithus antarcticus TaxID=1507870 RepID=A0A1V8SK84_9PEZI|nr:hypothetical protein B0A48_14707 [Cryoendolithus antarcticus]